MYLKYMFWKLKYNDESSHIWSNKSKSIYIHGVELKNIPKTFHTLKMINVFEINVLKIKI